MSSSSSWSADYTDQQQLTIAITPKCTSSLSMICSSFIIYEVLCDQKRGRSSAIQRALLGMSSIDIMASFGWWLSTWAVPRGTFALSAGNTASCNFQGFLLQLAIGAPLYNCSLALYYLMVIKYNWSNTMLMKIEKWVHAAILSFSIGTAIILLPFGFYNQIGAVCWIIGDPPECGHSSYETSDIPCERGDHAYLYGLVLFYGPLWVCVICCISSMIAIYLEVRSTHRRLSRYSVSGRQISTLRRSATDTQAVASQAILYSLSFFLTWTPSTIWSIAHWFNIASFWFDFVSGFCEPLQGFWNLLIFLRRRPSSRYKIRRIINRIIPCFCKEPAESEKTEDSEYSGHFTRGMMRYHSRRSSSRVNINSQSPANGDDASLSDGVVPVTQVFAGSIPIVRLDMDASLRTQQRILYPETFGEPSAIEMDEIESDENETEATADKSSALQDVNVFGQKVTKGKGKTEESSGESSTETPGTESVTLSIESVQNPGRTREEVDEEEALCADDDGKEDLGVKG